jgi:hypothetical protein
LNEKPGAVVFVYRREEKNIKKKIPGALSPVFLGEHWAQRAARI